MSKAKKPPKPPEPVEHRMFVTVNTVGICTPKGKLVTSLGFSGKIIAEKDRPVTDSVHGLLRRLNQMIGWSSVAAADADIDAAIALLEQFRGEINR